MSDEPWDLLANALTSFSRTGEDEDDVSLDFREQLGGGSAAADDPRLTQTPLGQSKRLAKIRAAVQGLLAGRLDRTAFLNTIRPLVVLLQDSLKVMESSQVQERFAKLSEEEHEVFKNTVRCFHNIHEGLKQMLGYETPQEVEAAMRAVESAHVDLHHVQSEVVEIGRRKAAG